MNKILKYLDDVIYEIYSTFGNHYDKYDLEDNDYKVVKNEDVEIFINDNEKIFVNFDHAFTFYCDNYDSDYYTPGFSECYFDDDIYLNDVTYIYENGNDYKEYNLNENELQNLQKLINKEIEEKYSTDRSEFGY